MITSTIPFDFFWNNYGHFQLQNQQGSTSSKTADCSFENLSAMQESTKQSMELKSILEHERSFPDLCQCPISTLQPIKTQTLLPHMSSCCKEEPIESKIIVTPTILLKPSDIPPIQFKSTDARALPLPLLPIQSQPLTNQLPKYQNSVVDLSERSDDSPIQNLVGKAVVEKESSRFCPYKAQRKNFKKSTNAVFESLNNAPANTLANLSQAASEKKEKDRGYRPKNKRFEWSALLHEEFIKAYETLSQHGYPTPKQIMNQMERNGAGPSMKHLTRIHVNTHLQKYELSMVQTPKRQSKFFAFRARNIDNSNPQRSGNNIPSVSVSK